MKKILFLSAAMASSGLCLAQEVGRVISSTPLIQQVGIPRQVCTTEQEAVQQPKSGAGALIGAIAGGAMGNAVGGGGAGKAAATMLGLVGGAVVGDRVEGAPTAQVQNVQRCGVQTFYENRPVAYNVIYEFGGRQYSVQMPNDPGPTLQLQITPVGSGAQMAPPPGTVTYAQPVYEQPSYTVMARPAYPGYYEPNYFLPFALGLGFGFWGGFHGHGHWH